MKRTAAITVTVIALAGIGLALPGPAANHVPDVVPEDAVEVAPNVYNLGQSESGATGYMFIHEKERRNAGPPAHANPGGGNDKCYSYIFDKHTEWQKVEDYGVAPHSENEVTEDFFHSNMEYNIQKWEDAAGQDIMGDEVTYGSYSVDTNNPDGQNEVLFQEIGQDGVIAYTVVWAQTRGSPSMREIVEWDMAFDTEWNWNAEDTADSDEMDFENIATHELGHAIGMGHTDCTEQTMYGYASKGETKKRTLENGDKTGASKLY